MNYQKNFILAKKNNLSLNKLFSVVGTIGWSRTKHLALLGHALLSKAGLSSAKPSRKESRISLQVAAYFNHR
jgi:hypothetical protein